MGAYDQLRGIYMPRKAKSEIEEQGQIMNKNDIIKSSMSDARIAAILSAYSAEKCTLSEDEAIESHSLKFIRSYCKKNNYDHSCFIPATHKKDICTLIENGTIVVTNTDDGKEYSVNPSTPVMKLFTPEQTDTINSHIKLQLDTENKEIFSHVSSTLNAEPTLNDSSVLSALGKHFTSIDLDIQVSKLITVDYMNYAVEIAHRIAGNRISTDIYCVCLLIFSSETNNLYLVCEDFNGNRVIIRSDKIVKPIVTEYTNDLFNSPKYLELFKTMYGISVEEPQKVSIEFDDVDNNMQYFQKIKSLRVMSGAAITRIGTTNRYIYSDKMSGVNSFAHLLKPLGCSCRVAAPQSLADVLIDNSRKIIDKYNSLRKVASDEQ